MSRGGKGDTKPTSARGTRKEEFEYLESIISNPRLAGTNHFSALHHPSIIGVGEEVILIEEEVSGVGEEVMPAPSLRDTKGGVRVS